jgi:exopolysaccharide production protein ExoQ
MTPAATVSAPGNAAARMLSGLALFLLCAVLPIFMVLANKSAIAVIVGAALCAVAAALAAGDAPRAVAQIRMWLASPLGVVAVMFTVLAAVSVGWSHFPAKSLFWLGEALLPVGCAVLLAATLPRRAPGWLIWVFYGAMALAIALTFLELLGGMPLRKLMDTRLRIFALNRSVETMVMLVWPLVALLLARGSGPKMQAGMLAAGAMVLALAVAAGVSESGSALVAFCMGIAAWLAAKFLPRMVLWSGFAAFCLALLIAPFFGELVRNAMPAPSVERLQGLHAHERIELWQSFGSAARQRPWLGTGFASSPYLAEDPVAREIPPAQREALGIGHPHNAFLQIWTELGAVGALLAFTMITLVFRQMSRASDAELPERLGALATFGAVALVSHGAWQGWWLASVGATIVLFMTRVEPSSAGKAQPPRPSPAAP